MSGLSRLTEREREILRLLARGYDAKSSAAALGISVNTVNERLRDARQKLGLSSSREAARTLAREEEAAGDNFPVDEKFGLGSGRESHFDAHPPVTGNALRRYLLTGGIIMLILAAFILGSQLSDRGALPVLSSGAGQAPIVTLTVPTVVSTTPPSGAVVKPGPLDLSVTFNVPMQANSYSFVRASAESYPTCGTRPVQSKDRRTFALRCQALPNRQYEVWFNRPPYMNFKSEDGVPARPSRLLFRTRAR